MHPISPAERGSYTSSNHYPLVRMLVSASATGINTPGEVLASGTTWTGEIPTDLQGIRAFKPTVQRILGYDPLVSFTVNADLDNLVTDATLTLHLGSMGPLFINRNLSPFGAIQLGSLGHPSWRWSPFDDLGNQPFRQLFDAGVYVQLEAKIISPDPRLIQNPPNFQDKGPVSATSGDVDISPVWPPHIKNDIALLIVETAAETATLSTSAGFVQVPGSPQTTGTAGGTSSTRLQVYWCRASSNNMASPVLHNPGNHIIATIVTFRGCITTGNPWDVTPAGNTSSTPSVQFGTLSLTLTSPNNRVVAILAVPTDMTGGILDFDDVNGIPILSGIAGEPIQEMRVNANFSRDKGNGGGIAVLSAVKAAGGSVGAARANGVLKTSAPNATLILPLKPPPPTVEVDTPETVEWHPFFTGRIDSTEPTDDDHLILRCRDIYCDLLDGWIANPIPLDSDDITELLRALFGLRPATAAEPESTGMLFNVIGVPEMVVPEYVQQPMPVFQAMREAGLQNGWDLRGRYGIAPYDQDQYVLAYYEPDRALEGFPMTFEPWQYLKLANMGKDRDEVRNDVRVTPADLPRTAQQAVDVASQIKYGIRLLAVSEDATSLILDEAQALFLANAIRDDLKEPKASVDAEVRFYPWVEINDVVQLNPNVRQMDTPLLGAVTGYTHTYSAEGMSKTTLRLRGNPAAASREWRRSKPKTQYVAASDPAGSAVDGARWLHRRP